MTVPSQGGVELWGALTSRVRAGAQVVPRTVEWLPKGLEVEGAELIDSEEGTQRVRLQIKNSAPRGVELKSNIVLAELHNVFPPGGPRPVNIEAVVGPCCESVVTVGGQSTKGLIDSGSQVTIISETFYRTHLNHLPLEQLTETMGIVGAGGQNVPYLGVVATDIKLPEDIGGSPETVTAYAVVCPDTKLSKRTPVIVGTNTLRQFSSTARLPLRCEVAFAYCEASNPTGCLGSVKVPGRGLTVKPHDVLVISGRARRLRVNREEVLVQEPVGATLPDGLQVLSGKAYTKYFPRVRVTLVNRTSEPIKLKGGKVIADLFCIQEQYSLSNVLQQLQETEAVTDARPPEEPVGSADSFISKLQFGKGVDETWRASFTNKLLQYQDVFNMSDFQNLGRTDVQHDIELTPGPAIRERPRPVPPQDREELRQHLQQLLEANIIRPSSSPFASPIVLVRKKNGALRMCCDYRRINSRTVRDSYALPKIEDLFMTLGKSKFFSGLDLSKAYYQVPLTERAKKVSAFTTPFGLYEFERLSFGMVNAPMTFQRLMEQCFGDMNLVDLIIFLDDLLIHAETLEELGDKTIKVLDRLRHYNLKLDPDKCVFGAQEVRHLGFLISGDGLRPDPSKIEALTSWKVPTTVREVKSFIGFAGYYRRHVKNFSQITKPLQEITAGYIPRGSQKKGGKKATLTLASDISHLWTDEHQQAFNTIIERLTSEPLLGLADKSLPFQLHCDASGTGLGAVLYQEQGGKLKVIAYASRGLNKTEVNYPAHKREFLALKWAMTDKFHDYLVGSKVSVVTDNNPLCYVLKNARLDATSHRWLASLSLYDFELRYRRGSAHSDADGLSRRPHPAPEDDPEYRKVVEQTEFLRERAQEFQDTIDREAVVAIMSAKLASPVNCLRQKVSEVKELNIPAAEFLTKDPSRIPDNILEPVNTGTKGTNPQQWRTLQMADPNLRLTIQVLEGKADFPPNPKDKELGVLIRERPKLELRQGVLYRRLVLDNSVKFQLVVPSASRRRAIQGVHEDLYHISAEAALQQARLRFFWPFMARDIEKAIKSCTRCVKRGAPVHKAPMQTITTSHPLELLSIDFLSIENGGRKQDILVILDHFTKFACAIPTPNQSAKQVAKVLWEKFFLIYGFPSRILSDQGRDFESNLIKELCKAAGITKCRTTPYHPSGNPVERWNRTLLNMLRSLDGPAKRDWKVSLPSVVHAYNCCIHSSTGYSPYYLFFGRHPRLPIDLAFGMDIDVSQKSPLKYVQEMKSNLKTAYDSAKESMADRAARNKSRYDVAAHAAELEVGDLVLVRRLGHRVCGKLSDKWEDGVYTVTAKSTNIPVYTVTDSNGVKRTLHRNMLLPVGHLNVEAEVSEPKESAPRRQEARLAPPQEDELEEEDVEQTMQKLKIVLQPERPYPATTLVEGTEEGEVSPDNDTEIDEGANIEVNEDDEIHQAPQSPEPATTEATPSIDVEEGDGDDLTLENESLPGSPTRDLSPDRLLAQSRNLPPTPVLRTRPVPAPRRSQRAPKPVQRYSP